MTFASFAPFGACFSYDRFATAIWDCEKPNKSKSNWIVKRNWDLSWRKLHNRIEWLKWKCIENLDLPTLSGQKALANPRSTQTNKKVPKIQETKWIEIVTGCSSFVKSCIGVTRNQRFAHAKMLYGKARRPGKPKLKGLRVMIRGGTALQTYQKILYTTILISKSWIFVYLLKSCEFWTLSFSEHLWKSMFFPGYYRLHGLQTWRACIDIGCARPLQDFDGWKTQLRKSGKIKTWQFDFLKKNTHFPAKAMEVIHPLHFLSFKL